MLACMRDLGQASFCTACFSGQYPTPLTDLVATRVTEPKPVAVP